MELFINTKKYIGKFNKNGKLIIKLTNENLLFFQQWAFKKRKIMLKKEYVKDFQFINGYEQGILYNCYPILSKNLKYVLLEYDYNSSHLELPCS